MNTIINKGYHGNQAKTTIKLDNDKILNITTMKRSNGLLSTTASVGTLKDGFISHMMFQDYAKTLISEKVRVTTKAVENQHNAALESIETIKADIEQFYQKELA